VKSIGSAQSSGCFRMLNSAVMHLASTTEIGTVVNVVSSLPKAPVASAPPPAAQPAAAVAKAPPPDRAPDYRALRAHAFEETFKGR
jgi:hypothetical protein